ncbi:N-acetylmannosamine-6-phosphate 2-epimerase [Dactylosporangium aurantiacum]|uniref:Putative N-acetylmannosamine-6-phosphate 2-epimerase n=1 Tax=Dactylosporangium aurantiacum TaxID=35754 RepID=A0A9Q9IF50_9ACTN|nr:N-acetylmannosamine-6-phosphate 2-epimerase [Dactylosporangium aurantiacum]MDG6103429.1 N-acetylmannosamine-6-phosphate 2-epimerase [Dactylosporangium aurantiacum]UWZ52063.1 N-acetylmannosamine-6-phosphate 2-epimerase [Dactylosporangium aurantiacum]
MRPATAGAALLTALRGGLVVSCQAEPGEPLDAPIHMTAMALAARAGGAVGVRAKGLAEIAAIRAAAADLPLIGLVKRGRHGVYITPTVDDAIAVAEAGADIVAIDGTDRHRPDGRTLAETVAAIRHRSGVMIMADVASEAQALAAQDAGVDIVSTTLAGYTEPDPPPPGPDLALVARLARTLSVPFAAEGRFATPQQCAEALRLGAHTVVVGTAITRPSSITARFAAALRQEHP